WKRPAVERRLGYAALDAVVLYLDHVPRRAVAVADGEAGPLGGDARVEAERVAAVEGEAEDGLDGDAVQPPGRAGVPRPPAAPHVRLGPVHVGGDGVGLRLVAVGRGAGGRVGGGEEHREEPGGEGAVAALGESADEPQHAVGVLPAVLADAGEVALDVAGVVVGPVEGGREEPDEAGRLVHEVLLR